MRRIAILDAPSNLGLRPPTVTSVPGCAKAPGALRDHGLLDRLHARDAGCLTPPRYDPGDWRPGDGVCHAEQINAYSRRLADRIADILDAGEFPVVLGGDCSIVIGSGLAMHRLGAEIGGRIGLVFVDGHSDFRHPGNASYVGAAAGEDLALVTGRGQPDLAAIEGRRPYYRDIDVVVMGIRAQDEYRLDLQAAGIVTRPVPALRAEGAARSAQWARDQLVDCAGYWVHVDMDVLDPAVMPAVDAPSPGGIAFPELELLLAGLVDTPDCLGVEITVFDPDYDHDGSYAAEIVSTLVAGLSPLRTAPARPDLDAARQDLAEPPATDPVTESAAWAAERSATNPATTVAPANLTTDLVVADVATGPATTNVVADPVATDVDRDPVPSSLPNDAVAADVIDDPVTTDLADDPVTADVVADPVTTDLADDPVTADVVADPVTTDLADDPVTADVVADPVTTDLVDDSVSTDLADDSSVADLVDGSAVSDVADRTASVEPSTDPGQGENDEDDADQDDADQDLGDEDPLETSEEPTPVESTDEAEPTDEAELSEPAAEAEPIEAGADSELIEAADEAVPAGPATAAELADLADQWGDEVKAETTDNTVKTDSPNEPIKTETDDTVAADTDDTLAAEPEDIIEAEAGAAEPDTDPAAEDEPRAEDESQEDEPELEPAAKLNGRGRGDAAPGRPIVPRPLGSAPLLDSEPLPATRPGMLRPRPPEDSGFSLPVQRPAFDLGSGEPADIA